MATAQSIEWENVEPEDIPLEKIAQHDMVKEILNQDLESDVKLPMTIKGVTLMSPGIWNGIRWTEDEIKKAFRNTDFSDKHISSLFLDHRDQESGRWVGTVKNPRLEDGGKVVGDLVVTNKQTAMDLHFGAKFGISPKVVGDIDGDTMKNFQFSNFSVVMNPAVKTAFINNSENGQKEVVVNQGGQMQETENRQHASKSFGNITEREFIEFVSSHYEGARVDDVSAFLDQWNFTGLDEREVATLLGNVFDMRTGDVLDVFSNLEKGQINMNELENTAFETIRKRRGESLKEFYAVPRDPPSDSKLPIYDKDHVINAMARFNQTEFASQEEKQRAFNKIMKAAEEFDINVDEFKKLNPTKNNSEGRQMSDSVENTAGRDAEVPEGQNYSPKPQEHIFPLSELKVLQDQKFGEFLNEHFGKNVDEVSVSELKDAIQQFKEHKQEREIESLKEEIQKLRQAIENSPKDEEQSQNTEEVSSNDDDDEEETQEEQTKENQEEQKLSQAKPATTKAEEPEQQQELSAEQLDSGMLELMNASSNSQAALGGSHAGGESQ